MNGAKEKQARRRKLFLELGFEGIVEASAADNKVAINLSRWLCEKHDLDLQSSVVRRWLTKGDGWQEPRVTVGLLILDWWDTQPKQTDNENTADY